MKTSWFGRFVIVLWVCVAPSLGWSQTCGGWEPGGGPQGIIGTIRDVITWDTDGDGPALEELVVIGDFVAAGDQSVPGIAAWNGERWRALPRLWYSNALGTYRGQLVGAGNRVLLLTEYGWREIGTQVGYQGWHGSIDVVHEHEGELIVAGTFDRIDGVEAHRVARWSEETGWRPLSLDAGTVTHLCTVEGELTLRRTTSGTLPRVLTWNGVAWTPVQLPPEASSPDVIRPTERGLLITQSAFVWLRENGLWTRLSGIVSGMQLSYFYDATFFQDTLHGAAQFSDAIAPCGVARWDGQAWRTLDLCYLIPIRKLVHFRGQLIAVGTFSGERSPGCIGLASWDGQTWSCLGGVFGGTVNSVSVTGNRVLVAGNFTSIDGRRTMGVGAFENGEWTTFPRPPMYWGYPDSINHAIEYQGDVIVGGRTVNGEIFRWSDQTWIPMGQRLFDVVIGFIEVNGDLLVLATSPSGLGGTWVRRWTGTLWETVASLPPVGDSRNVAGSFQVWNGQLIIFSSFQLTQDGPLHGVLRLVDGGWEPMGSLNQVASCSLVHDGELYCAGYLVWRWNGEDWEELGTVESAQDAFVEMAWYQGRLVVAQRFPRLFELDGDVWRRIPSATLTPHDLGVVRGMHQVGDRLMLVGSFHGQSGGSGHRPAEPYQAFVAFWSPARAWPQIRDEGAPTVIPAFGTVAGSVCGTAGTGDITFQWFRDGVALQDGPEGGSVGGGEVAGATTCSVTVSGARPSDSGVYQCRVTDSCGSALTVGSLMTVVGPCNADYTRDGRVDQGDVEALILDLASGSRAQWPSDPDVNADGSADQGDLSVLLDLLAGLPCPT